jgi:hypothetical protein
MTDATTDSTVTDIAHWSGGAPFADFDRIHLVPPLTTSPDGVRETIAIFGEALAEAASTR